MKIVKKNVYYCDFCKRKRGLSAGAMAKHEKHCTLNPKRECRLCEELDLSQKELPIIIEKYKKRFEIIEKRGYEELIWNDKLVTLDEISKDAENCPNCILTILRCTRLNIRHLSSINFEYKKALGSVWAEINAAKIEDYSY